MYSHSEITKFFLIGVLGAEYFHTNSFTCVPDPHQCPHPACLPPSASPRDAFVSRNGCTVLEVLLWTGVQTWGPHLSALLLPSVNTFLYHMCFPLLILLRMLFYACALNVFVLFLHTYCNMAVYCMQVLLHNVDICVHMCCATHAMLLRLCA